MNLSLNELTKMATQEVNFDETFFTNIEECIKYNSIGTLNWAIHTLTIIRERIDVGQKVKYKNIDLTPDTYKELLHEHYGIYVVKGVYPKMSLKHKVYFILENTENGMDLIYTGQEENKLFRWIADINENESLVRVLPTNVVYIRNIKLGSLTPFVTEHNSVYVYNEKTGKIEEVFE